MDEEITEKLKIDHINWVSGLLDESDIKYLNNCDLFYEIKLKDGKKILFEHFLIKDYNEPYPFEDNNLKTDVSLWYKYKKEYEYIFIGHEHEILDRPDSNLWIVGSAGCTKDNITSYTSLEIGNTFSIKRIYINYDRKGFEEEIKKIDYPNKEHIIKKIFNL